MKPNQHRGEDRDPGDRRPGKRRVRGCRLRAPKPACNHLKLHRWLPGSADPLVPSGHSSEPSPGFCPLREPGSSASERERAWTESPTAFLFLGSGRGRIQFLGGSVREGRGCWGLFSISTPLPPLQGAVVISTGGPERCQPGDSTSPASPAVKREDGPRSQGCRDPGGRPGWQPLQSLIHGPMRPALHGLRKQLVFLQWRPGLGSWWEGHRCLQGRAAPAGLQQHCGPPAGTRGRETGQEQRKRLVSHSSAKCPSLRRPASASQASEKQPHLFPGAASSPCACGGGGRGEVAIYSAAPISELQTCGGSFTRWMERPGKL